MTTPSVPSPRTVLVVGATGTQGGAVARALLERGFGVRGLTRESIAPAAKDLAAAGVDLRVGDLDRPDDLTEALRDVDGVFSVQDVVGHGDDGEARQGCAVMDAARAAGVSFLVQASAGGVDRLPDQIGYRGKHEVETHLRASGLPHAVIAPTWFMSNWSWPTFAPAIAAGTLGLPLAPDTAMQQIAPADIGAVAAAAFADPDAWNGRRLELAGDERTVSDIAEALAAQAGHPVRYEQIPWSDWRTRYGAFFHDLFRSYQDHGFGADLAAIRREFPATLTFDRYLAESR